MNPPRVRLWRVMLGFLVRHFVALIVVVGLLLGHSAFASCGMRMAPAQTAHTTQATMAGDMDCCPKGQSAPDAPKCPLMALCAAPLAVQAIIVAVPRIVALAYRQPQPADEADHAGLASIPPPKPPRSTV